MALQPLLAGAITTNDVFGRVLSAEDLVRIDKLIEEVSRKGGPKLRGALKPLVGLRKKAQDKSIAQIFGIKEKRQAGASA